LCSKAAQSWSYIVTSSSRRRGARRVAERNLTSPPSQIRTGHSRVIRLLPPSLRPHTLFPQDK
jgi:hypothetical protein